VITPGTYKNMLCFTQTAPTVANTFTLDQNGASSVLTCTINAGATTGSGTDSTGVTLSAGDLVDVAMPTANAANHPVSFAIGP
jgi:hypothetical protein